MYFPQHILRVKPTVKPLVKARDYISKIFEGILLCPQ